MKAPQSSPFEADPVPAIGAPILSSCPNSEIVVFNLAPSAGVASAQRQRHPKARARRQLARSLIADRSIGREWARSLSPEVLRVPAEDGGEGGLAIAEVNEAEEDDEEVRVQLFH